MDPAQYLDAGESVVMLFTMRTTGKGSGIPLEREDAIVFRLDDGRITRIDYYNDQLSGGSSTGFRSSLEIWNGVT